ncbi:hypothetical protein [Herbaspirillum seropedicae]|nr:hypothetical protein [Herbaspirillum seropedicae]
MSEKIKDEAPQIGGVYRVVHVRKGTFRMRVYLINDEWATGVVLGDGGAELKGEEISIRISFAKFFPMEE